MHQGTHISEFVPGKPVVSRWQHATQALSHRQAVLVTGGEDSMGNAVFDPQLLDTSGGAAGPVAPSRSRTRSACVFAPDLAILAPHPASLAPHRPPCYAWLHPGAPRLGNVAPLTQAMVKCLNPKPSTLNALVHRRLKGLTLHLKP